MMWDGAYLVALLKKLFEVGYITLQEHDHLIEAVVCYDIDQKGSNKS